jgi:hypothetical protein
MFSKYRPKSLITTKYIEINKLLDELANLHNEYQQKTQDIIEKIKNHKIDDRDIWMYESYLLRKNTKAPINIPIYQPIPQMSQIRLRSVSEPPKMNKAKSNGDLHISFV